MKICYSALAALWLLAGQAVAQTPAPAASTVPRAFSLKEAIDYAIKNNLNVSNAQIDITAAGDRVNELKATGLPQVGLAGGFSHTIQVQPFFGPPGQLFGPPDPTAPPNTSDEELVFVLGGGTV
jgi:outer membrane protein TolC